MNDVYAWQSNLKYRSRGCEGRRVSFRYARLEEEWRFKGLGIVLPQQGNQDAPGVC